ncbi:MAG: GHKL domain-containing protein [bacterium]|nr:GHKL domain-containing protein [bacterium]
MKKIKLILFRYRAIIFILSLGLLSIIGVLQLFNMVSRHNVTHLSQSHLLSARRAFIDLEVNTGNMLSATLEALVKNKEITANYLSGDRKKLYESVRPIYRYLKSNNNITHWYFLRPEPAKTCFLRVHYPNKYGDVINRTTMDICIRTKQMVFGKDLGKTALALRAVRPYYHNDSLIGYMELGVELEYFLHRLKMQTQNDYTLLIQRNALDKLKWDSVSALKSDEQKHSNKRPYLLVAHTTKHSHAEKLLAQLNLHIASVPRQGLPMDKVVRDGRHCTRGIFPYYDAAGRKIGIIAIRKDITPMMTSMISQERKIILMIIVFMGMITFVMLFIHKRAEKEMKHYRGELEEMVSARTAQLEETNRLLNLEIDEHKRAEEALTSESIAREEAEQKRIEAVRHAARNTRMASMGVMAAGITHEINQPLNAIKVTADSIRFWHQRNPGRLPNVFVEQFSLITESVDRIVEIIQHMRAFWVVKESPQISRIDINQAVKNALSLTRQQMNTHNIQHNFQSTESPLLVDANLIHVEQIIMNLLVNAIHALDEVKRETKTISLVTRREPQRAVLEIHDNGPGLPSTDPDKLFDPFFSTHTDGSGTGLGLAIVKRYIDRYNGVIDAQNGTAAGAKFSISFPCPEKNSPQQIGQQIGDTDENPTDR